MLAQVHEFGNLPFEQLVFFSTLLWVWAMARPNMVRDYDGRRLPNNTSARAILAILYVVAFAGLVLALHVFGATLTPAIEGLPYMGALAASLHAQAPLLAIMTLGALWQISIFRDLEKSLVITLHSARHLRSDSELLTQHLMRCAFKSSEIERSRNFQDLRKHGVFVKADDVWNYEMVTVGNWRKVSSLLRLLNEWNPAGSNQLSDKDRRVINDIATAHERKTQLAMTIVKMLEMVAEGRKPAAELSQIMERLTTTPQLDRAVVTSAEVEAEKLLKSEANPGANVTHDAVRISAYDLRNHLLQIERYFETEYELLLESAARLVAKSVALAGDCAPQRLEQLKSAGFAGLGTIERINFDRILWLFLIGSLGGFLVMFLGNLHQVGTGQGQMNPTMLAQFAVSMAIAGLIGAVVGSNRNYVTSPSAPWAAYVGGGLIASALFIGIGLISNFIRFDWLQLPLPAGQPRPTAMRMMAWSTLPFVITVGIAYFARFQRWPMTEAMPKQYEALTERVIDGATLSGALLIGWYLAIGLTYLFGFDLPPSVQALMNRPGRILPVPVMLPLQVLGFLIGFFFVRDVRRAAHATIVDASAPARPGPHVMDGAAITQPHAQAEPGALHAALH